LAEICIKCVIFIEKLPSARGFVPLLPACLTSGPDPFASSGWGIYPQPPAAEGFSPDSQRPLAAGGSPPDPRQPLSIENSWLYATERRN